MLLTLNRLALHDLDERGRMHSLTSLLLWILL